MKKGTRSEVKKMGPLKVAKLNGLSVSRQPVHDDVKDEPEHASNDERVRHATGYLFFKDITYIFKANVRFSLGIGSL